MSGSTDKVKGSVKKAVGTLTKDDDLVRDGRRDEQVGHVKNSAEKVIDAVTDKLKDAEGKLRRDDGSDR